MNLSDSDQIAAHLALHGWVPVKGAIGQTTQIDWCGLAKDVQLVYAYKNQNVNIANIDTEYAVMFCCAWGDIPINEQVSLINYMENNGLWT